ncbi:MAG: ATP-grasp domain-containing protein, partial [Bacteroidales bacterium]|nr:ATP-grasp domain-containing protein [Bacteroidales bacterium]
LDLLILAQAREYFASLGCQIQVSSPEVIATCQDKRKTVQFLRRHGFEAPSTYSPHRLLQDPQKGGGWPYYMKPWDGSAGQHHALVHNKDEVRFFAKRIPHAICQEYMQGTEYTCDVYVDRNYRVRCVVPRRRLEVRHGEVSKAKVVKDPQLISEVTSLVSTLKAGPGVVTVQVIVMQEQRRIFLEINPRFGGGIPLAIHAGADMPYWLLAESIGRCPRIQMDGYTDGLQMLRYDDEIWIH